MKLRDRSRRPWARSPERSRCSSFPTSCPNVDTIPPRPRPTFLSGSYRFSSEPATVRRRLPVRRRQGCLQWRSRDDQDGKGRQPPTLLETARVGQHELSTLRRLSATQTEAGLMPRKTMQNRRSLLVRGRHRYRCRPLFETGPPRSSNRPLVLARALMHVVSTRGDGVPPFAVLGRASAAPQRPSSGRYR